MARPGLPSLITLGLLLVARCGLASPSLHEEELLRDGVTVLRQVVDRALLADIADASNALIDSDATQHLQRDAFTGSLIPVTKSSAFLPLITHAPTLDALAAAGLGDARWLSGYVISKPPSSPSLGWHQDAWYWDEANAYGEAPVQLFAMFYLTNTSRDNGCLRAIPGSHRRPHALHGLLDAAHSEDVRGAEDWAAQPAHQTWDGEVDVAVDVGDVVVGDARVLHAAHANNSTERRTVITMWFMPRFSDYSREFRARTEGLHVHLAKDLYAEWPAAAVAAAAPYLPISRPVGEVAVVSDGDEYDHNLDAMVRAPGWTGTDAASARAYQSWRRAAAPRGWLRRARGALARVLPGRK